MKHVSKIKGGRKRGRISLPTWETYCDNTTAANALVFDLGELRVWFSYKTPVAFLVGSTRWVRQNRWGPTTGKHINAIDGGDRQAKAARIPTHQFECMLDRVLDGQPALVNEPDAFCYYCNAGPYLASEEDDCLDCGEAFSGPDEDQS
jgi:hypothetical protein